MARGDRNLSATGRTALDTLASTLVGFGGELLDFATGMINVNTGVATTTDSVFQIGSNTKFFTATPTMQLVDAGDLVVALLTNSMTGGLLWRDLVRWLFEELVGMQMPDTPMASDPAPEVALDRFAGSYERLGVRHLITVVDGELLVTTELTGSLAELQEGATPPPYRLRAIDQERFATRINGLDNVVVFQEFERGRPKYFFAGWVARPTSRRPGPPAKRIEAPRGGPASTGP